jgi:hypothetical protein
MLVVNPFRPRRRVEIENLFLRHQLNIVLRRAPHRLRLRTSDRTLLVLMTWLWPSLLGLSRVVKPVCVPKTSSALISGGNQATSLVHVQTILLCFGYFGRGIQVEEPA